MSENRDNGEIAEDLKRLLPARSEMDSRFVFYEAGFNAGKSQQTAPARFRILPLIAAGLLAAIVTAPAGYRAGRFAVMQAESETSITVTQTETIPAAVATKDLPNVDQSPRIESKNRFRRAEQLASWIDPLHKLAETARIERQSGTTLAAFHSSLVQRENSAENWPDFPFPLTSTVNRDSFTSSFDIRVGSTSSQPLAVSDLRELAMNPEGAR